jgi:integrase
MATEKPKARRRGSIERLGDRKFKLTVYVGATAEGKRVYFKQVVHGTKEVADRRLSAILDDIANGRTPTRTVPEPKPVVAPVLLDETLDRWLKHKSGNRKARARTISNYQWLLDRYVKPVLGAKPIAELTELDIQECYNGLLERGISAKTARNLHKCLEPALTRAVGWGLIPKNPALHVELPVWDREEAKYLPLEQVRSFLAAAKGDKWYAAFMLAIEIGPRPNEYLALRWSDIDFDNRSLTIRRSLYWPTGGGFAFTKPKTQRSNRTVTISATAIEALRQHRRMQLEQRLEKGAKYQDLDLVFATELGTPLLWRNLARRHLKPLLTAAGIAADGFSLYSLRHTAVSAMIANGVDLRVIAEIVGTSVALIDTTYSHVPRSLQQSASDRMANMLYGT